MEELYRRHVSSRGVVLPNQQLRLEIGLTSSFHEAWVELVVDRESLGIQAACGEMTRAPHDDRCIATSERLDRLVGLSLGPGLARAVRESVGGPGGCKRWEELVMTAALAIRQASLAMQSGNRSEEEWKVERARMVQEAAISCRRMSAHKANNFLDFTMPAGHRQRVNEAYRGNWMSRVWLMDPHTLRVESSLCDTYHEPWVELEVELPTRRITRVKGAIPRNPRGPICTGTAELLQGLVGQTAWPGDSKAVRETVGGVDGCIRFEEVVNEAYRAVYQAHHALILRQHRDDPSRASQELYSFLKDTCLPYAQSGD